MDSNTFALRMVERDLTASDLAAQPCVVYVAQYDKRDIHGCATPTLTAYFEDGSVWHFSEDGSVWHFSQLCATTFRSARDRGNPIERGAWVQVFPKCDRVAV